MGSCESPPGTKKKVYVARIISNVDIPDRRASVNSPRTKLAKFMEVNSVCGDPRSDSTQSIRATIDWGRIENKPTLDELTDEIRLDSIFLERPRDPGTVITLSRLRRPWTDRERVRFIAECRSFQVPDILKDPLPSRLIDRPLLFEIPRLRDATNSECGFDIRL